MGILGLVLFLLIVIIVVPLNALDGIMKAIISFAAMFVLIAIAMFMFFEKVGYNF